MWKFPWACWYLLEIYQGFLKISKPFEKIAREGQKKLVSSLIIISENWCAPFEVMFDSSRVALGVVLGQRKDKILHPIYYESKALIEAQNNYTLIELELLAVVFAFYKLCF